MLDLTDGVMWYQIAQEDKENSLSKTTRKATGNHLALFFRRRDMDGTIGLKDNGINEGVSQRLAESRSAGNGIRRSQSSEILTTKVGRKKFHLKIACSNRTVLPKGKLENVKHEMAWLGINVLGINKTRWHGDGEYKSDGFRVIHSGGEESHRGVAIILDKRTANCVEMVRCEGDRLLMVKLKGKPVDMCINGT